jgi:ATP-dependent Zn protease
VLLVIGLIVFGLAMGDSQQPRTPTYAEFLGQVERGHVRAVTLKPERNSVEVETRHGERYKTAYPNNTETELLRKLRAEQVAIDVEPKGSGWISYLIYLAPIALLAVFWLVLARRSSAASSGLRRMTRSPAQRADANPPNVTFRDVAGVDEGPRGCGICLSRPSRTARASSLWTRSTRWAATGGPVWGAATTSASRP